MYHELVYHLDLCILSYQLYTQSLVWPLDPYYEHSARVKSQRRESFIRDVRARVANHNSYRGPGEATGWQGNDEHDPIVYCYEYIHPWRPAIANPEAGEWLLYNTPTEITRRIGQVRLARYSSDPSRRNPTVELRDLAARPNDLQGPAPDLLYCFEGGTGGLDDTAASYSVMGLVLSRELANGKHDVHIVFRGSRSGSAGRALIQGLYERGNPDWISDMDFNEIVPHPAFSAHGSVCRGFRNSVLSCMPTILACLEDIHTRRGRAPKHVTVTGHSLGGGLAAQFAAAMVMGATYGPNGSKLPQNLQRWPWYRLNAITFSAPVVGGRSFHREYNSKVHCRRVVLSKDPITQSLRGHHVGAPVYITGVNQLSVFKYHEPMYVRQRLLRKLTIWGDDLSQVPAQDFNADDFPWKVKKRFNDIATNSVVAARGVHRLLSAQFPVDIDAYMEIYARVAGLKQSYPLLSAPKKSDRTRRTNTVDTERGNLGNLAAFPRSNQAGFLQAVDTSVKAITDLFKNAPQHIVRGYALAAIVLNDNFDYHDLGQLRSLRDAFAS